MTPDSKMSRIAKRVWYRCLHASRAPHTVQARCCGLTFCFSSRSPIGEEIFANAFERVQRSVLDRLITSGQTIIDVGANFGFYTCLLAKRVGPRGRVIAFEPTPKTFDVLREHVILNRLEHVVDCHNQAMADQPGNRELYIYEDDRDVYNSLGAVSGFAAQRPVGKMTVPTVTLDQVLEEAPHDRGCFIKIDVEGFQHQVLLGGQRSLRQRRNVSLMVEMHEATSLQCGSSARETLELMTDCGFAVHLMTPRGLAPFDARNDLHLLQDQYSRDLFFCRPFQQ
jgi:FkbM family methyltransferase